MKNSTLRKRRNGFESILKVWQGAKALVMLAVLIMGNMLVQAQNGRIDLRNNSVAEITHSDFTSLRAIFSYGSIESIEVPTERGTFSEIAIEGTYPSGEIGTPELPATHQLLAVPFGATPHVRVISYSTTDYRLSDYGINTIMPHQPSVRKDQRPEDIVFAYNAAAYRTRALATAPEATIEVQGTMRGIRIGSLVVNPVSYNPTSNILRVFNNVEVEVSFEGADYAETERMLLNTYSPYFDIVYKQMFNYRQILDVYSDHPDLMAYPVHMIVITPDNYMSALQPWLNWKIQKGFDVDVYTTSQTGTTYSAIRSYVQNLYNTGVNQGATPTFLILVGDVAQVPNTTGSSTSKVTDLYYGSVDSDYFPDMFYSRMSAENTTQLTAIVDKILQYEQYTMSAPSYLNNVTLIAGWDSYWTSYVGAPTINYATTYYYNTAHGFSTVNSHINQSQYSGCYNALSTGVGFVNYTAHGSETSWSDPSFTVSNVNALTNTNKYFLAMGNCCLSGNFGYSSPCFGEAMIRGANKAAYSYIGSCPETYWYEDYYFGVGATNTFGSTATQSGSSTGVYDAVWMDDTYNTVSSMVFLGNIAVCYANAGNYQTSVTPLYYWQAYHVLGDGSIMPYRVNPTANTVSHASTFPAGASSFLVHAQPGSYVGISQNNTLIGAALVPASGSVNVPVTPVSSGQVKIVVTKPQRQPYIQDINVDGSAAPTYVSTNPTNRNVIIEEYTGRSCGYCPDGHRIANELAANNPGRVFAINLHTTSMGSLSPTSFPNLNTTVATTLTNAFAPDGIPMGVVNRSTSTAQNRGNWENLTNAQLGQVAECNVGGEVTIDPVTRTAYITVEVYYTGSSNYDQNYLTVAMLQDSILGSQSDFGNYNPSQWVGNQYCHMHTLRDVITQSAWGDAISPTTPGSLITRTYTYQIPETIGSPNGVTVDLNNIYFLAWVSETYQGTPTRPILTGCKLSDSSEPYTSYTITATANPSNGGTVTGGGIYLEGATCTLIATANSNYSFTSWTKNGAVVSTNPTYSFTVTGNADYVANFSHNGGGNGEIVEIGDGTGTTYYGPYNSLWGYSFVEQVYTADEIGMAGTITSISFNMSSTSEQTNSVDVFMKNVSRTSFSDNTDWEPVTASDMVFSGTVTFSPGWTTITLDTPFEYDGSSNLMIGMHEYTPGYSTRYFYYTSVTGALISAHSDTYDPDPYDMGSYSGTKVVSSNRPNVQLNITTGTSEELTVYDGSATNGYVPVYGFYCDAYLKSEFIMPAATLSTIAGGTINRMEFYATQNEVSWGSASFQVFMKEVDYTNIDNFSGMDDATIVYEGSLSINDGIMDVTFTTPYHYNGGNLLIGFYEPATGSYVTSTWYGETVSGASVQGYNYNGLDAINPTQRNFLPKTTFHYLIGNAPNLVVTPDPIDLGYRPNGAWMRPLEVNIFNEGTGTILNGITVSNPFFQIEPIDFELPYTLGYNQSINLDLSTNGTASGVVDANLVVNYGGNEGTQFDVTATAYDPVSPDVWELAELVTSFPYTATLNANNVPLYDNYRLPPTSIADGADAVYKLVFTEDTYLNASVTNGENGKVALYPEGFMGLGGPDLENSYRAPQIGVTATTPFEAQIGEGTNTFGYFPFYTLYNYSIAENLFLASELADAGVTTAPMTSLSWYATNAPGYAQQGISIWMANVADETLTTTSYAVTGMTLVYTGAMTPVIGWNEFVFNEGNFAWDGHSNILIYCQRNNGEWNSTVYWQSMASLPFNASAYKYQDSGAYDPTVANTMYTSTTRPNIIMKSGNRTSAPIVLSTATSNPGMNNNTSLNRDGWLHYDNGIYSTSIGTGNGTIYWASMFPASMLTGNTLSKVALYENEYNVDPITLYIYSGGTSAPSTLLYTQTVNPIGGDAFHEIVLSNPVTIDPTQNLWVVFSEYGSYPANACEDANNVNNRWVSIDGSEWMDLANAGVSGYGWMIRAYIEGDPGNGSINNLTVTPGTYYLVASSTSNEFTVEINIDEVPCPELATSPYPADAATEVSTSVYLSWELDSRTTEYRLMFGTTYYCEETLVDWTDNLLERHLVYGLNNNTNYFWRIDQRNDGCPEGVIGQVWGFTTHLNVPLNLYAYDFIHQGEDLTLTWDVPSDRSFLYYNIYQDYELIGSTYDTYYTISDLPYNIDPGYYFNVTAVYDEGESNFSNTRLVRVTGEGIVEGYVYEQDGVTPIQGARVEFHGTGQVGGSYEYYYYTDENGHYSFSMVAGTYNGTATCWGYQDAQHDSFTITYNELTSDINFVMDELFNPVSNVIAEYYPDADDPNSPYVKVYWDSNLPIEDFEAGDFSQFDWQVDPTYPWSITTVNPYEGTYCMKSGGAGVANVVSNMTVTVNIPADGEMSFFGKISCESSWDYGYFYIDGTQMGSYTGNGNWGEKRFNVTAGDHTFQWRYTKDSSVDSYDDCFYVDYITFYKRPEPVGPGWHTYLESDFDNAYRSNVGDPSWGYEYPTSVLAQYAGYNLTKVAVFSDAMYSAVGGNFTCNVYKGGSTPGAGTLAASITVDVPVGLDQWCEYDLNNAVNVTGTEPLWVIWTVNDYNSNTGYPAGCASHTSQYGDWWNPGDDSGWTHMGSCTWTMKNYFTNRGRTVVLGTAEMAHAPMTEVQGARMDSHLRTFAKGETMTETVCINPNATIVPKASNNTRAFSHYRVYRTGAYNNGPYTQDNTMLLADEVTDSILIDVTWTDAELGVYKYGVSCVYEGNRESQIIWGETNQLPMSAIMFEGNNRDAIFSDDFENGLDSWTTIDADGDGYNWILSSTGMGTGYGHNGSNDMVYSQSYYNGVGVLYPDNYLITPQLLLGGTFGFWACAQDANYAAEHFGIAVSTAGNTNPNDFTMVQEWTMAAKAGNRFIKEAGMRDGREGDFRSQGNWYYYEVDLSAYGGQTGFIAIRHFNCSDQFYLNIDDVEYFYYSIQQPRESQIRWSNPISKDMMLGEGEVNISVTLNSGDSPEGTIVRFINQNSNEQQYYPVADIILDATGYYEWDSFRKGDYRVIITKEGYEIISEQVSIWDATSLNYVLTEILYTVSDLYVSSTGWAMWNAEDLSSNGDTFSVDFDNSEMPSGWTTIDGGNPTGYGWQIASTKLGSTGNGHNASADCVLSQSYDNNYGVVYPDNYLISPAVTLANGSTFSFWACAQDNSYAAEHFGVFVSTSGINPSDFMIVDEWTMTAKSMNGPKTKVRGNRDQSNWYQYTVDLSAYAGAGRYIAIRHFNCSDWFYLDVDDIALTNDAKSDERHLENNQVVLTDSEDNVIFSGNTTNDYMQLPVENLIEGEIYRCKVSRIYSTGTTDWMEVDWVYQACDNYEGASEIFATTTEEGNLVSWTYPEIRESQMGGSREMWDLMATFNAAESAQYGVATDGQNIYTCNWGYSDASYDFFKYDMQGNVIEGFNIDGCSSIRDLTYDGQYFYGGNNSNILYCIDLANKQLINTYSTECSVIRHCSYDPINNGFWVGGWSDLMLISRSGAILTYAPAVQGVSGSGYYEDEDGIPYLYLFTQSSADAKVYAYNILTNTVGEMLFDFSMTPGYDAGSSGGAFIGEYNGKIAFFGDVQQNPNLIGIYELGDITTSILGAMVYRDNELVGFTPDNSFLDEGDTSNHQYSIRVVYGGSAICPDHNIYYSMSCPQIASMGGDEVTQVSNLAQGWNWWSTYIEQDGIDGLTMLENSLGANGHQIKSQTDFVTNFGSMWMGMLTSINNEETYMLDNYADCQVVLTGTAARPSDHPITVSSGWSWIGYPCANTMSVAEAFSGYTPSNGDQVKSQSDYAMYYGGMWIGQLQNIVPGTGLMYKSNSTTTNTLVYPDGGRSTEMTTSPRATHWTNDIHAYPNNMTVMAVVELDGQELDSDSYELAAFDASGECRGSVRLMYVEPIDHHVAFLTVSGKDAAELNFGLYDIRTGREYFNREEALVYVTNATIGNPEELYVVRFRSATGLDELASSVQVFPNPVQGGERFSILTKTDVKQPIHVEIVNALGATIAYETSTEASASFVAPMTAGVYMLRIHIDGLGTCTKKLIIR